MKMNDKYLNALKSFDGFVVVSVWAQKFGEMFPEDLKKANKEAEGQIANTTGIREITARISSVLCRGAFHNKIEIDTSERPRMIRYIKENELELINQKNLDEDIEPLKRDEIIRNAKNNLETKQIYRLTQFEQITKELNKWFGTRFEVEHSKALLNEHEQGKHHPDNIQILLKSHNSKKNNKNWERFTLEKQIEYINKVIDLQKLVLENFNLEFEEVIFEDLINRLRRIY